MTDQNSTISFVDIPSDPRFKNLTGQTFGHWDVLGYAGKTPATTRWWCKCVCGAIKRVYGCSLRSGESKSCGCEAVRHKAITHGGTVGGRKSPEYAAFQQARARCENPNRKEYARYGGRGIKFRFESFSQFLAELGKRPTADHSLDRIDNDGNYEAGNVRWATIGEQQRNLRSNRWITIDGTTQVVADWAKQRGISPWAVRQRLLKGWCDRCAVEMPLRGEACPHLQSGPPAD